MSCKRCLEKNIKCTYPDYGDVLIRTSRLASYECLLDFLCKGSGADVEAIIYRLRQPISSTEDSTNTDRLKSILAFVKRLQEASDDEAVSLVTRLRSGKALDDGSQDAWGLHSSEPYNRHFVDETDKTSSPLVVHSSAGRDDTISNHLDAEPVLPSEEPSQMEDIFYSWNCMFLSDTTRVQTAVDAFFESSDRRFLVFTKETIMRYYHDIYSNSVDIPQRMKEAELCCLCAVAALGMRFAYNDEQAARYSETLYHTSTNYFSLLYKILPLDAIKVCTLLANFNIKNKRTGALAFVEIGLSLCTKHNIYDDDFHEPRIAEDTWPSHCKPWRALLFQSLLLSSTLSYVSGGGLYFEELALSDVELETVPILQISVSRELTKLCILKANIIRMDFTLKGRPAASPGTLMQELQNWYRQLPNDLYLAALMGEQRREKRVAIYYVNLMFLSATGLFYRRTASRFLRSVGFVTRRPTSPNGMPKKYKLENARESILAAQQAARIFEFLVLEEVSIWKCWLVIFQAYTTCTVLMHSTLQKQIYGDSVESWTVDLHHAQSCIAVLERCGPADSTISRMHNQLADLFRRVANFTPLELSLMPSITITSAPIPQDYLLTVPEGGVSEEMPERIRLSTSLLVRLCGPFENLGEFGVQETYGRPA
ncbi:GroES-like protein [Apiospora arundinis]